MPVANANGIEIAYESFGPEDRETVLLIMGLGAQLTQWPIELCEALVTRGYRVVRFDNRDVGLSSRIERGPLTPFPIALASVMAGKPSFVPYTLGDMAADAIGLLDQLGIARAHIVGASLGGMIAQLIAADYPERTLSLTSIMSTSGNPLLPLPRPQVIGLFMSPAPSALNREAVISRGIKTYQTLGSPGFPTDQDTLRAWVMRDAARAYYPIGVMRQMAAVMTNGDRRPKLRKIRVPTVVLHGKDDPLVPVEAGRDTAANIQGAELRIVPGMGHDIPLQLIDVFADAIEAAAKRASPEVVALPAPAVVHAPVPPVEIEVVPEPMAIDEAAPEMAEAVPHILDMPVLPLSADAGEVAPRGGLGSKIRSWLRRFLSWLRGRR